MLYIDGLDLTNVVSFKEVSVDFKESLTYVRGVNKDSDPVRPTGNGTGKSLFFSSIPNVWYSATPLALRKKSRKDILARKGSQIGLIYRNADGPEYEIIQKGSSYQIFENGTDLEIPTIPKAEAFIKQIFPITEIDFYSRCYVSTQRPYSLLRDSDSDRLQHIVDIARLDQYSVLHKHFTTQASSIKDNEIRLSVLEQQHGQLLKKLKSAKSSVSKESYDAAKEQLVRIEKSLSKKQKEKFELIQRNQALDSLLTIESELDGLRAKYKYKERPSKQLKILKESKSAAREWQSYDSNVAHFDKASTKLQSRIDELKQRLPKLTYADVKEKVKQLKAETESLSDQISELEDVQSRIAEVKKKIKTLASDFEATGLSVDDIDMEKNYDEILAEIRIRLKLQSILDHEKDHDDGKCPTCQSDIDFDSIRRMLKLERKNLDSTTALRDGQKIQLQLQPLQKELRKISKTFDADKLATLKAKADKNHTESAKYFDYQIEFKQLESYESDLSELEKPKKPKTTRPEVSLDEIETGIELCHEIEKHLKAKATLIEANNDFETFRSAKAVGAENKKVAAAITAMEKEIRGVESKQAELAGTVSAYEQYVNTVNVYREEKKSVEAEIAKLKPSVANKKLVTILTKAYGTKGLRAYAANTFCNLLQTNLNHYRDLIFSEPFEFSVEASDTGVSILVDRNNGKTDAVSDVRHLSGAESECFALLCAAALITLTPDQRKLNMIVLDEPTSHMHPVTKDLFTTKFLPFLRELVPTVFIIDNTDDPMLENSQQWTVVKNKGVSSIKFI